MKHILYQIAIFIIFNFLSITEVSCINIDKNKNEINIRKNLTCLLNEYCDSLSKYNLPENNFFDESWKDYSESQYPYFCETDFNGDKISDYAIILVSKNKKELFVCVILSIKKSYKFLLLKKFKMNDNYIPIVLDIEKKGIWESANDKKTIKNDGLIIYWLPESKSFMYYCYQNNFIRFFTD